jgi:serine/threonine protein kinase
MPKSGRFDTVTDSSLNAGYVSAFAAANSNITETAFSSFQVWQHWLEKRKRMSNRSGQQLGHYRLLYQLGHGGFADTYLGEHIHLKTYAAIKILQTQLTQEDRERFFKEAQTIAHLTHPNIVRVMDFGIDESTNTPYLVMEYAPNGTLRQRYPRGISLPVAMILPHVRQIASALHYAHSQKVIHRDVKPENMLIGSNNQVLLSDFGIAIIAENTRTIQAQDVAGTITYMAPEQIEGKPRPASDQYALAVVVYEWLCGRVPFTGSYVEVAAQHRYATPPLLREYVPTIPGDVERVILIALSKDPKQRFGSVEAFANALEQASKGTTTSSASLPAVHPQGGPIDPTKPAITPQLNIQAPPPVQPPATPFPQLPQTGYGVPQISRDTPSPYTPPPPPAPGTPTPVPMSPSPFPQPMVNEKSTPPPVVPITPPRSPASGITQGFSLSKGMIALIVLLAALLIVGSSFIYYVGVYEPGVIHSQATATANAQLAATARVNATNTAFAEATVNAQQHATATAVANVTATQTALQNIYTQATNGTPAINDPLSGPDNYGWADYFNPNGGCHFVNGTYHGVAAQGYTSFCYANATNFTNLALQAQVSILNGHSAGLIFHVENNGGNGYAFRISTDGTYIVNKFTTDSSGTISDQSLTSGTSSAITQGNNQTNTLAVVVHGNTFYFYINQQYVDHLSDTSFPSGAVGVYVTSDTQGVEASFSNLKVWKLLS